MFPTNLNLIFKVRQFIKSNFEATWLLRPGFSAGQGRSNDVPWTVIVSQRVSQEEDFSQTSTEAWFPHQGIFEHRCECAHFSCVATRQTVIVNPRESARFNWDFHGVIVSPQENLSASISSAALFSGICAETFRDEIIIDVNQRESVAVNWMVSPYLRFAKTAGFPHNVIKTLVHSVLHGNPGNR